MNPADIDSGEVPASESAHAIGEPDSLPRHSILRNVGWGLLSQVAPLLAALIAYPLLVTGLGEERFGILALVWAAIGYFSVFDLGLGRALTQSVAERRTTDPTRVSPIFWTSLLLLAVAGLLGLVLVYWLAPLAIEYLRVPDSLRPELIASLRLISFAVPLLTVSSGLRGALEAYQRFDILSFIRVPTGILSILAPVAVLTKTPDLGVHTLVLVGLRGLTVVFLAISCLAAIAPIRRLRLEPLRRSGQLLRFGGWMTITNLVGPLMATADRYVIGAIVSVAAVTYYATSFEVVSKLWIISGAFVATLFPAFASYYQTARERAQELLDTAIRYLVVVVFPIALVLVVLAPEILSLWLGEDFASRATMVWRWLAIGMFVNCVAQIAFAYLQGTGHPRATALTHLAELIPYSIVLYILTVRYGPLGAALAWTIRSTIDAILLFVLIRRNDRVGVKRVTIAVVPIMVLTLLIGLVTVELWFRLGLVATLIVLFYFTAWRHILDDTERYVVKHRIERVMRAGA